MTRRPRLVRPLLILSDFSSGTPRASAPFYCLLYYFLSVSAGRRNARQSMAPSAKKKEKLSKAYALLTDPKALAHMGFSIALSC